MFFLVMAGFRHRRVTRGVVGPLTCGACGWTGTFWMVGAERRFTLYWVPVGSWRVTGHETVCRNCSRPVAVPAGEAEGLLATMAEVGPPDPLGPAPAAGRPAGPASRP